MIQRDLGDKVGVFEKRMLEKKLYMHIQYPVAYCSRVKSHAI